MVRGGSAVAGDDEGGQVDQGGAGRGRQRQGGEGVDGLGGQRLDLLLDVGQGTGADYLYNVHRLLKKFATAATLVPAPVLKPAAQKTRLGVLYFGSTAPAMDEALHTLAGQHIHLDAMRLRAYPFPANVAEFIAAHEQVFVVEQNRDGQMRRLLVDELEVDPKRLPPVLHYDGTPITARFITQAITERVLALAVRPQGAQA